MRRFAEIVTAARFGTLVACAAAALLVTAPALAERQSSIVKDCDGNGTTIVKLLPTGDEYSIVNLWSTNLVNGTVRRPDATTVNINCTPLLRTDTDLDLGCRIYDPGLGTWGDTTSTRIDYGFLNGGFPNPYEDLFATTGEFLTIGEIDGEQYGYRLRLLDGAKFSDGTPFLEGQTAPETLLNFLEQGSLRSGGTTKLTNFTLGLQTNSRCFDFDVTPTIPHGPLAGTVTARARNSDGTCQSTIVDEQPATLVPSGGTGTSGARCRYRVEALGPCAPGAAITVGGIICLPCVDSCRSFSGPIGVVLEQPRPDGRSDFPGCRDTVVALEQGATCDAACTGAQAIVVVPNGQGATSAVERATSRR